MEADLQSALRVRGTLYKGVDPSVLASLAAAAEHHGLAAKQAAAAFDKFMTVHRTGKESVGEEDVTVWRSEYGRSKPQPLGAARSNLFNRVSLEDMVLGDSEGGENGEGAAPAAPSQRITPYMSRVAARPGSAAKPHTPSTAGKFAERQNAGSVVQALNAHLAVPGAEARGEGEAMEVDGGAAAAEGGARCVVEVLAPGPLQPGHKFKFMVDRLEDRAAYLERRIVAAEEAAEAALGLEVHPSGTAAQDRSLFVGRICCDSEGGRLNPQSLLLEGSQRSSAGHRVRLDVSKLPGLRLFLGQVVVLLGYNPSGHCVVATQLLPGHALPLPRTALSELAAGAAATGPAGLSAVVAAGPFTSCEDLEYAPLGALLDYCAQPAHRPDVLLLCGPFVDAEHPLLQRGLVEDSFDDIYASRVLSQIRQFSGRVGGATRVLLVPSTRDLHHHLVLPQPPLDARTVAAVAGSTALPLANPSTLRCNEVVLGVTSADWLMGCNREELCRLAPGANEERLPALAAHLPAQRSYYPLFPPPADVPLDCSRGAADLAMPCTPDLLVLPSELAPFAKLCPVHQLPSGETAAAAGNEAAQPPAATLQGGSVVCINPGRLTKGASGGTFAHLHILPLREALDVASGAPAATNAPVLHRVDQRCRVEIKRI